MFPVIMRQSSLGVSMCPMLAWEREGKGWSSRLEKACGSFVRTLPGSGGSAQGLGLRDRDITPREHEAASRRPEGRS